MARHTPQTNIHPTRRAMNGTRRCGSPTEAIPYAHLHTDAERHDGLFIRASRLRIAMATWSCSALAVMAPACSGLSSTTGGVDGTGGATPLALPGTSTDTAYHAGLAAMRQYFNRVESNPALGKIESGLVEYVQEGGTGRFRDDALKFRNRMRQKATLWITRAESGSLARCQVRVQRLDTADHRVFRDQQRFDDLPNSTPIDREAGVSSVQNQAWTEMPRDRKREREILQVLFNQAAGERNKS